MTRQPGGPTLGQTVIGVITGRCIRASSQAGRQCRQTQHDEECRTEPEQRRAGMQGRPVEHELAIALHHVAADVLIGRPGRNLLANTGAQIHRQISLGIGDGLVLADQAAQLECKRLHARLDHGLAGGRSRIGDGCP